MAAQWYGARVGISGMFGKFEGRGGGLVGVVWMSRLKFNSVP